MHQKNVTKQSVLKISLLCSLFLLNTPPIHAVNSVIDTVMKEKESLVAVYALGVPAFGSPHSSVAIDPKTGRMLVASSLKTAQLTQKGAGVIIRADGFIVTNIHTIQGAQRIAIELHDGRRVGAQVIHFLPKHDLALLKINPPYPLRPIAFEDSNTVQLKDEVINIGSSDLLKETLSAGIVIGLGTSSISPEQKQKSVELIEVNINLYKGDSGGPLLNKEGKLIGMIVAKLHNKNRSAFAIPSNKIKKLYLDYIK